MFKQLIALIITYAIILCSPAYSAEKVFEYGFEDWGGSISSTPNYPFSSAYQGYVDIHEAGSEVVESYDGLMPNSGNYFWLINHGSGNLNPPVAGITGPVINPHNNVGLREDYGGQNSWDVSSIGTGECFIKFMMATDGWENTVRNGKLKLVRFKESTSDVIFYITYDSGTGNPKMQIYAEDAYHSSGILINNIDDRTWHEFAIYVNYNTGQTAIWYDVEGTKTWANATFTWTDPDGQISGGPTPSPIVLMSNWSAHNPTGELWHAIDDIEIWDGLPDNNNPTSTKPPAPYVWIE